jgi:glycosyltransferase involved in cell wall biosynthesis
MEKSEVYQERNIRQKRMLMVGPVDISEEFGPKVHFSNLAKEFANIGFKVLCFVYRAAGKITNSKGKNFNVSFSPNPLIGNLFLRVFKYLFLVPAILWQFFKFRPDAIYFRFSPPAFLYLSILKLFKFFPFNFKTILEFNDWLPEEREIQGERRFKVKLIKFLQVKSSYFSDVIRVVAPGIKENLIKFGVDDRRVAVVENGTDIEHFRPIHKKKAKKKIGLDPNCLYVGFIGNFAVWQGVSFLFKVIPEILKEFDNVKFLLVGDGAEMPEIESKAHEFRGDKVKLTGFVPYKDANFYINSFDIGLAPYIKDIGFSPLKIRDYAACGVPIISSNIKGAELIEDSGIGILFPVGDAVSLANSIKKLIKDSDLRSEMGRKGRKLAEERLSWRYIAEQILNMAAY